MGRDIAFNEVWGNMVVGCAALFTGFLIDLTSWRTAFWLPGLISVFPGLAYLFSYRERVPLKNAATVTVDKPSSKNTQQISSDEWKAMVIRVTGIIFFTTAVAGIVFQGVTFALSKFFEARLGGVAPKAAMFCSPSKGLQWLLFKRLFLGKCLTIMVPGKSLSGLSTFRFFLRQYLVRLILAA